jgi:hypothetical protein
MSERREEEVSQPDVEWKREEVGENWLQGKTGERRK